MANVLELENLRVRLGRREILKGISCRLGLQGQGRAIGLLGPNGAGKSTLIRTLLGFHSPTAGSARILGFDCHKQAQAVKSRIGYMPENDAFVAGLPAVTFVRLMAELSGLPHSAALEKAHEVLFHVGLGEARYRDVGTYSLGMKQMCKLAQAIVHGPDLVILDEPTNGLDPNARSRMLQLILEMKSAHGMNVLLCSHLLHDVETVCDEVVILKDGMVVHQADLEAERKLNRRFIELEVAGDDHQLATVLNRLGAHCLNEGMGRWRVVLPAEIALADLWRAMAELQLQVRKLTQRRDSLEEIFLKAMGHIAATPVAPPPPVEVPNGRL